MARPKSSGGQSRPIVLADARSAAELAILSAWYDELFNVSDPSNYAAWIETVESPQRLALEARIEGGNQAGPKLSILVPVYNPQIEHLAACIDSVLTQSYANWELCLANDASTNPQVKEMLDRYAEQDPRIRLVHRAENGHICAASNSALELATGDFCALLDHDDLLAEHALVHVVEAIGAQPEAAFLYSDEDKLSSNGERITPHFKPRFNPDLLLSQNYIAHLLVAKTSEIRAIGAFREGLEGSQDHDLALRLTERLKPAQIVHIPHILYHWRESAASTAANPEAKGYTAEAGRRAVADALKRRGEDAAVEHSPHIPNAYRVRRRVDEDGPLVSLIIPTRDGLKLLRTCVESIRDNTSYRNFEIIIVDNGSAETETLEYLDRGQADGRFRVVRDDRPFNFSALNNLGAQHAGGELLGLINNDIEVTSGDWLGEMVSHAVREEIGCVGARLLYPDGTLQHAGVVTGIGGVAGHSHKRMRTDKPGYFGRPHLTQSISAVTAACLLVRKSIYESLGGLEEQLAVAFNDVDFCLRVREQGFRNVYTPYAELIHHESVSRGSDLMPANTPVFDREAVFMRERWGAVLDDDPYYSPHLTREHEDFSIRLPKPLGLRIKFFYVANRCSYRSRQNWIIRASTVALRKY